MCESDPDTPLTATLALPTAAFAAVETLIVCGVPGVRLAVEGFAVTPEGIPLKVTLIVPVKPLLAVALTVRFWAFPAVMERLPEESIKVKSG